MMKGSYFCAVVGLLLCEPFLGSAQSAAALGSVKSIAVGSLGPYSGADELRNELKNAIRHSHRFELASSAATADAVLEGHGELWSRGNHSLDPRLRKDPKAAEPIYDGYLSVKLQGKDGETLWSYLSNPGRITFDNLKHQLAQNVINKLGDEISKGPDWNAVLPSSLPVLPSPAGRVVLQGAGATFPAPIYADWFATFQVKHPNWQIRYDAIGSAPGLKQLLAGAVDFAGSDIPPSALQQMSTFRAFPSVGGAVVLIYNLRDLHERLKLNADVIAQLFNGTIKTWDDARLSALNPSEHFPHLEAHAVHRAGGSGTSFAFRDYLSRTSRLWTQQPGADGAPHWANGEEASSNEEVAKFVARTGGSIGYVEFIYALNHHLNFALVLNAAGRYIEADLPSIMAAANSVGHGSDENLSLAILNSAEADAYPIATFTWLMFRDSDLTGDKRAVMLQLLEWMLTSGQRQCSALGYAPLPPRLLRLELSAMRKLQ